ncbi:PQQ-binding-like beta-propeller repeat protein [Streptomyces sp. NBC_01353]|uniref:outer membrane protein assembly factor BamB family protein n=1 Tax=Streptomyces sp. NBC_01353 TaxID=2903835 RepID=UPI002E335F7D|nr:PQQ-binding-like beta-propeller repeat protein [Streptomyces sp. NBC_01353]
MSTPQQPGPPAPTHGPYGRLNPYGGGQPGSYGPPPSAPPPTEQQPQAEPPGGRKRRTTAVIAAVVAALLAVGGVTWYALAGTGERKDDKASPSGSPAPVKSSAKPSGPPAPDAAAAARYNTGRGPGDASVLWVRKNDIDVPQLGGFVFGPWVEGDVVVTAMYRTVTAHSVKDGTVKWRLTLDTEICKAPHLPSEDGKIALALGDKLHAESDDCRRLQMVDLRAGKLGWQQKVAKEDTFDFMTQYSLAMSGGTVTFGRHGFSTGYRLSDGKKLFGRWDKSECQPYAYAGGPKLVAAVSCPTSDAEKPQEEIHEVDPVTGKSRWKYRLPVGYRVDHVLSVRPLVVSATYRAQGGHGIVVLNEDGTKRSSLQGDGQYAEGCADESTHDGNLQRCQVVADDSTVYMATVAPSKDKPNEIVAFDLDSGKVVRHIPGTPGRTAWPLRMEGGSLVVRMAALLDEPGSLATVAPGATKAVELLRVPPAAGRAAGRYYASPALYVDGRYILVQSLIVGTTDDEEREKETLMAFGK